MKTVLLKLAAVLLLIAGCGRLLQLWFQTYVVGQYYITADFFLTFLGGIAPIVVIAGVIYATVKIIRYKGGSMNRNAHGLFVMLIGLALATSGCDRGSANVQTLITDDCGVTWKLIPPGQSIPARIGPCAYKVTIPDYPMQGETKFKTSFKDRVLANVEISYEYVIFDGRVFIGEAKYIGKANSGVDDKDNSSSAYESAENTVIDKRLREATTSTLILEDIVDFSQAEYEDKLLETVNEMLRNKGVRLNFISFVPTPEEQTRLAIDMMTAMKVYESKGLGELGKAVATARAGAPQIHIAAGKDNDEDKK